MILSRGAALSEASDNHFFEVESLLPFAARTTGAQCPKSLHGIACESLQFSVTFRANGEKKFCCLSPVKKTRGLGFVNS